VSYIPGFGAALGAAKKAAVMTRDYKDTKVGEKKTAAAEERKKEREKENSAEAKAYEKQKAKERADRKQKFAENRTAALELAKAEGRATSNKDETGAIKQPQKKKYSSLGKRGEILRRKEASMAGRSGTATKPAEQKRAATDGLGDDWSYDGPMDRDHPDAVAYRKKVNDFIYQNKAGKDHITPINPGDEMIGAKGSGPIAGLLERLGDANPAQQMMKVVSKMASGAAQPQEAPTIINKVYVGNEEFKNYVAETTAKTVGGEGKWGKRLSDQMSPFRSA